MFQAKEVAPEGLGACTNGEACPQLTPNAAQGSRGRARCPYDLVELLGKSSAHDLVRKVALPAHAPPDLVHSLELARRRQFKCALQGTLIALHHVLRRLIASSDNQLPNLKRVSFPGRAVSPCGRSISKEGPPRLFPVPAFVDFPASLQILKVASHPRGHARPG